MTGLELCRIFLKRDSERTTASGGELRSQSYLFESRYSLDAMCGSSDGWLQYPTDQDAWYFGVWVHRKERFVLCYAEGDLDLTSHTSDDGFAAELVRMAEFYGPPPHAFTVISASGSVTRHFDAESAFGRQIPAS